MLKNEDCLVESYVSLDLENMYWNLEISQNRCWKM